MNPIGTLCLALSSGCGTGFVLLLRNLRVAQDAVREDADPISEWLKELPEVRSEDVFVQAAGDNPAEAPA